MTGWERCESRWMRDLALIGVSHLDFGLVSKCCESKRPFIDHDGR